MQRRIAATALIVVGVVMAGTVIGTSLFSRSSAFERLSARTRTSFTAQSIAQQRQDLADMQTIAQQLQVALPALAQQAQLSTAQLQQFLAQFPDFTNGSAQLPAIVQRMQSLVDSVDRQRANFASADAIPTKTQKTTNVPWFILLTGILAVIVGLTMLASAGTMWAVTATVLGAMVIAVPLATSLPQKAADSDALNDALRPIYTEATIASVQGSVTTLTATATSLQTEVLPAIGQRLNLTAEQIQTGIAQFFPGLATALQNTPGALSRMGQTAATLSSTRADFVEAAGTSYAPIAWTVVGCGIAILLLATYAAIGVATAERKAERYLARRAA